MEEYTVQDVTCVKCGHIRRIGIDDVQDMIQDFKCRVCYTEPGHAKTRQWRHCATCNQTMFEDKCFCPNPEPTKIVLDPQHKWMKNHKYNIRQEEIDISKAERELKKKIQAEKERQAKMPELILNELKKLTQKEETPKPKEMNNSAIQ